MEKLQVNTQMYEAPIQKTLKATLHPLKHTGVNHRLKGEHTQKHFPERGWTLEAQQ